MVIVRQPADCAFQPLSCLPVQARCKNRQVTPFDGLRNVFTTEHDYAGAQRRGDGNPLAPGTIASALFASRSEARD
jgi:hypothetical protein